MPYKDLDMKIEVDCIIPVYNEEEITSLISEIESASTGKYQLYLTIVDDGSIIPVKSKIKSSTMIQIITHRDNLGNGAAIKTGLSATQRELVVLMDGDGQHNPSYLEGLIDSLERYDLVVASREHWVNCSIYRALANRLYCRLASWLLGQKIHDITSGFRVFRRSLFRKVFPLFPNKFSSPTTLVLFAYLLNRKVGYYPIKVRRRAGKSKIRILNDGLKFMHRILKIGIFSNPIKFFYALAAIFIVMGMAYTALTVIRAGRLYIPNGATIFFIFAGLSVVIAHVVDFAKIILVLLLHDKESSC